MGASFLSGLTMDLSSNNLYWVNVDSETIQYYDFTNSKVVTLPIDSHRTQPRALTIYKENLYYADNAKNSIYVINKLDGSNHRLLRNSTSGVYALKVYDANLHTGKNLIKASPFLFLSVDLFRTMD